MHREGDARGGEWACARAEVRTGKEAGGCLGAMEWRGGVVVKRIQSDYTEGTGSRFVGVHWVSLNARSVVDQP